MTDMTRTKKKKKKGENSKNQQSLLIITLIFSPHHQQHFAVLYPAVTQQISLIYSPKFYLNAKMSGNTPLQSSPCYIKTKSWNKLDTTIYVYAEILCRGSFVWDSAALACDQHPSCLSQHTYYCSFPAVHFP